MARRHEALEQRSRRILISRWPIGPLAVHLIYADMPSAQDKAAIARQLVGRNGTARERSHVENLALTTQGQSDKALEMALGHLESWPRDAMMMSLPLGAFGLFAFSEWPTMTRRGSICPSGTPNITMTIGRS